MFKTRNSAVKRKTQTALCGILCALFAFTDPAFSSGILAEQSLVSAETIDNRNQAFPPSQTYMDALQRSPSLFKSETEKYLQSSRALVFHTMIPYYTVQRNEPSCSLATAVMLLNTTRAVFSHHHLDAPATQNEVLEMINDPLLDSALADDGPGVSLDQFGSASSSHMDILLRMFSVYKVCQEYSSNITCETVHVEDASEQTRRRLHNVLMDLANEERVTTLLALNFDGQYYTDSVESIGHFSPVGGYDPDSGRVLILDVDGETGPYWVAEETLLSGLNTLDNTEDGSGPKYRGYVLIRCDEEAIRKDNDDTLIRMRKAIFSHLPSLIWDLLTGEHFPPLR